jgi:SPP1 family predicted phage head-tail adaptor
MIPAGELKHRVTIRQRNANHTNEFGEVEPVNTDEHTRWAKVEPLSSRERFQGGTFQTEITHRVRMRYTPDIGQEDAIVFRDRVFQVAEVINVDEANEELQLLCKEQK